MIGRQNGHSQVKLLGASASFNTAVLRTSLLGNVHSRHDLETRNQGTQQSLWRTVTLKQHTVDAVANSHPILKRFNVNVTGTLTHRFRNDQVGQTNDGSTFVFVTL